jgi:predicted NAD/FAD-binding protein
VSRRTIAVIGSGVSGLTAAYLLQKQDDVTLYEREPRLGGHAHTHELTDRAGRPVSVDSGFIVHNEKTYPNLLKLFAELGVATQPSEMSMSVSCKECGLEYAGAKGFAGLFPTAKHAASPKYLRLLTEVPRFHKQAKALLETPDDGTVMTLGEFLDRGRFSPYFRSHFMTPVVSAVWSCSAELADQYPARYLFSFLQNHGMLTVTGSPEWRTVVGGSGRYVERAAKQLTAVHTSTPVRSVTRHADGVEVRDEADQVARFDAVVIATHPDTALAMLGDPSVEEKATLGAFEYSVNPTVLHHDTTVLPKAPRAHASWNYHLPNCSASADKVHVSYDMNRLQRLETNTPYLVTLNDPGFIDEAKVIARMRYEHPIFTPESVGAQANLPRLNDGVLAFAGAYHGWGFHEDGCRSGVEAALSLGATPW